MRKPNFVLVPLALVGAFSLVKALSLPALAQDKEGRTKIVKMTPPVAGINPVKAMRSAEAKVGGSAKMAIFELDEGHWIYGVVVAKGGKLLEVDVDPVTGKAGDSEAVTPEGEAKEFQESLAKFVK